MINSREERLLCIGPYSSPEDGTSIPTKLTIDYIQKHCVYKKIRIIDTQSSNGTWATVFLPHSFFRLTKLMWLFTKYIFFCDKIIIFGSPGFVVFASFFYIPLARLLKKNIYVRIYGGKFDFLLDSLHRLVKKGLIIFLNKTNLIILETNQLYARLVKYFPKNLSISSNCRYTKSICSPNRPRNDTKFFYAGGICLVKGIDTLIEAILAVINENNSKIYLDLYGPISKDVEEILINGINASGGCIQHRANYLTHNELLLKIPSYDALVVPTIYYNEGLSGIVIDSLTCGVPAIVSNFNSLHELIISGYNGFMFKPTDINSLKNAIENFVNLSSDEKKCIQHNAIKSSAKFDAHVILPQLCKLFELKIKQENN